MPFWSLYSRTFEIGLGAAPGSFSKIAYKRRTTESPMKRVEKDPKDGWIARRRDGSLITDEHWRWNSRSAARSAVAETDMLDAAPNPR